MDSAENSSHGPREMTVTCKQCGSTSLTRLDHHEYKCTHCGAITVVSDDDAVQLESMLGSFFKDAGSGKVRVWGTSSTQTISSGPVPAVPPFGTATQDASKASPAQPAQPDAGTSTQGSGFRMMFFLLWLTGLVVLYGYIFSSERRKPANANTLVPVESLTLTGRFSTKGIEAATLTNTSKHPVDLLPMSMISYVGGAEMGMTPGRIGVTHLLPNEHTIIDFPTVSGVAATRFGFNAAGPFPVSKAILPHLQLQQAKLQRMEGTPHYELSGIMQNPSDESLQRGSIALTIFNVNHEAIAWAHQDIKELDSHEATRVVIGFDLDESSGPIVSYEYLIDMAQTPYANGEAK
jgi:hypothetical protein